MQLNTVDVLCCPVCHGRLAPIGSAGDFIEEGALTCSSCRKEYPVRGGIPVFLDDHLSAESSGTDFAALDEHSRQKVLQRAWHDRERLDHGYKRVGYGSRTFFAYLLYYQMHAVEHLFAQTRYSHVAHIGAG